MIALAWKMLVWFGIGVAMALSVLIVPLHVAAERKKLDATTAEVAQAERDIRALETEFETRSNIAQLEKWNGDTLRLSAPVAAQYVRDEAALASLDFHRPLTGGADVRMASAIVPSQAAGSAAPVATTPAPAAQAPVAMAAVLTTPRAEPAIAHSAAMVKTAAVTRPHLQAMKTQAVAMLDRKLLSDSMLGDLASGANAEARRLR
ncbi:hypothetical protein ASG11_14195 [Sphingomonas sp. Leaf357]|uniref:hypothetical protein n=1 Tax=Sphingomonas sp. Leaf357 TaxID=1736350 RepID=UPI0006F1F56D|nr:hypothetical protein [Sphingomonas sp. Leaf357]KQS01963.1 hypothetical protein ASG11_14195 [Sphingomonas sp. Leaf357]